MFSLLRPLRFLAQALSDQNSSRQIAWGFALGLVVGLVPKGNLIAVALMTGLCTLRINLGAGMLAAFVFSWVGMLADPLTHRIGLFALSAEPLRPVWTWLYDRPIAPWTAFNNTIVMGSLLLGIVLAYPVFRLTEPAVEKYKPRFEERLKRLRIVQVLWGAEWTGRLGA